MKNKEIQKLIEKYLLLNLNKYQTHSNCLYKIEGDYFLKGYYFESRGNGESDLRVWCFINPLFVKKDGIALTNSITLTHNKKISWWRTKKLEWWDIRKEKLDETFQLISKEILNGGEQFLNSVNTAKDFYNKYKSEKKDNIRIYQNVAYSTILFGTEQLQNKMLKGLIRFSKNKINDDGDEMIIELRKEATLLLNAGETKERLKILRSWADETIRQLVLADDLPASELTVKL